MKFCFKFVIIKLLVLSIFIESSVTKITCPKICVCDVLNKLMRATCSNYKIIDINLGVSKSVQIYDLSDSSISKIEDYSFTKLSYTSLEEINLSGNKISWIGLHAFAGLNNLRILNLANNFLEEIPNDLFYYNPKLYSLDISNNKLSKFNTIPFLVHDKLQILKMGSSRISSLPLKIFDKLPNLKELDLQGNYLEQMIVPVVNTLPNLRQINLQDNPWKCNNVFDEFQNWLKTHDIKFQRQCGATQKFEKLLNFEDSNIASREETLNEWSDEEYFNEINTQDEPHKTDKETVSMESETKTFLMLYNERVPSTISLLIGFQMGIVIGILGTYCWMGKLYKCKPIRLTNHRRLRRMRRQQLIEDTQLLTRWNTSYNENFMTPPSPRRMIFTTVQPRPLNIVENQNLTCEIDRPVTTTPVDEVPGSRCSETPPPTYKDCLNDTVIRIRDN